MFVAALVVIAGQAWVARSLGVDPFWLFPLASAVLLVASLAVYEGRDEPGKLLRILSFLFIALLVAANAVSLVLLVRGVFVGSTLAPPALLFTGSRSGSSTWPSSRCCTGNWTAAGRRRAPTATSGATPTSSSRSTRTTRRSSAPDDWKPSFYDYLYVSLTSSIAFSPTDAMPYTRRAKLAMAAENLLSFATLAVIVARAVNIARG